MKQIAVLILITLSTFSSLYSQRRIAAMDALLEAKGLSAEGNDVTVKSNQLTILYEGGFGRGELHISTLRSTDDGINQWISANPESKVVFSIMIPEGKFAFGNSMEEEFTAEAQFQLADGTTLFSIDFIVSNLRNNNNNVFQITGRGRISLTEQLGLTDLKNLQDEVSFQFMQNVTVFTP